MSLEAELAELRGRVGVLESALDELLENLRQSLQADPQAALEADQQAAMERMREKGRAVANRRFLGGDR